MGRSSSTCNSRLLSRGSSRKCQRSTSPVGETVINRSFINRCLLRRVPFSQTLYLAAPERNQPSPRACAPGSRQTTPPEPSSREILNSRAEFEDRTTTQAQTPKRPSVRIMAKRRSFLSLVPTPSTRSSLSFQDTPHGEAVQNEPEFPNSGRVRCFQHWF